MSIWRTGKGFAAVSRTEFGIGAKYRRIPRHKPGKENSRLSLSSPGGKTKTLAHRVAHRVLNGANPQRILLLTFSRRPAAEMTRRAALILAEVRRESKKLAEAGHSKRLFSTKLRGEKP